MSVWDDPPIETKPQNVNVDLNNVQSIPEKTIMTNLGPSGQKALITIVVTLAIIFTTAAIVVPMEVAFNSIAGTTTSTISTTTTAPTVTVCPTSNATANSYLSSGTPLLSTFTVNTTCTTYFSVAWLYTAQSTSETISITTYNIPFITYIDDVSIFDVSTSQELLTNGGFQSGTTGWSGAASDCIGNSGANCNTGRGAIATLHLVFMVVYLKLCRQRLVTHYLLVFI